MPSKVLILLVASCLVWIGMIALAVLALSGIPFSSGWIAAGALFFAIAAWIIVMFREMRESFFLPDSNCGSDRHQHPFPAMGNEPACSQQDHETRIFTHRAILPLSNRKATPRKLRSKRTDPPGHR